MRHVAVGLMLLCCATCMWADEASKSAKAAELLQITQTDQMMKSMLEPMKAVLTAQVSNMPAEQREKAAAMQEKMAGLVADRLSKAKPALVKIYSEVFTEEEIDGVLAFYKSPAGKAMLEKTPVLMQRTMPVMIQWMGDLQPEIRKMMDEMKQAPK